MAERTIAGNGEPTIMYVQPLLGGHPI